jgi:hypothetical protein
MKRLVKISIATIIGIAVAAVAVYIALPADCVLLR